MWRTDQMLLSLFNHDLASPAMDLVMLLATTAGLALVPLLLLVMLGRGPDRRQGLVLLAALCLTLGLTLALQLWVGRPRPSGVRLLLATPEFFSFPSGHASLVFCAATLLSLARRSARIVVPCLLAAALVSISRIYLGHHHPSDVACGALLGAAVGAACFGLWLQPGVSLERRLRWLLWPQAVLMVIITTLAYLNLLPVSLGFPYADKLMHFLLFGMVTFWLHLWLGGRSLALGPLRLPLAVLIAFSCALPEELAQGWSSIRSLEGLDIISDLAGMLVFVWIGSWVLARLRSTEQRCSTG